MKKHCAVLGVLLFLTVLLFCTACAGKTEEQPIEKLADLMEREAVLSFASDTDLTKEVLAVCPKAEIVFYDDTVLAMKAIESNKITGYVCGEDYIDGAIAEGDFPNIRKLEDPVCVFYCGLGLAGKTEPVHDYVERVNACIEQLRADGTIKEMVRRWLEDEDAEMPEFEPIENPEATLRIVTFGKSFPYSFMKDGRVVGSDVELAYRVAQALNCDFTLECAEYPAMLMGLATGKFDMVSANLYISDDRKENVLYSVPYNEVNIMMAVRKASDADAGDGDGFLAMLNNKLYKTFAAENRWMMLLQGLLTTMLITVLGFLLANLLGALFCLLMLSKRKWCNLIADAYSRIMQGLPLVVILMILFYIIFGSTRIPGEIVAIVAFGMVSGSSLAQQFYGGITSVKRGQREAALALGLTPYETVVGIVLPQAVRRVLPGYFSELIGLMKGTAIVGYVAVVDLTRVGDMIRSVTFDAFFPLFAVALIYFLIAFLLLSLLKTIMKRLEPKRVKKEENAE